MKAVSQAHAWKEALYSGAVASLSELANQNGVTRPYITRMIRLAFLAPDIVEAILDGRQPPDLTLERLRDPMPIDWKEQRTRFGFPAVG